MSAVEVTNEPTPVNQHSNARWLGLAVCVVLMALVVSVTGGVVLLVQSYDGRIYPGVRIDDFDVGGMTPQQATAMIQQTNERTLAVFDAGTRKWFAPWPDTGITVNAVETVQQAYMIGRAGNPLERLRAWQSRQSLVFPRS